MAAFDGKQTMRAAEFDQDEKARTFTLCRAAIGGSSLTRSPALRR
jgi:hypothetical protein